MKHILLITALIVSGNISLAYEMNDQSYVMVKKGLAESSMLANGDCNLLNGFGTIINQPTTYAARAYQCLVDLHKSKALKGYPSSCEKVNEFEFFFLGDSGYSQAEQADMLAFRLNDRISDVRNAVGNFGALENDAVLIGLAACSSDNNDRSLKKFMGIIRGKGNSAKFEVVYIMDAVK